MCSKNGKTELEYFGTVSASFSHDINNRLAVINEHAGLLEDYIYLYENGRDMDVERLKSVAETVKQNVSRANEIVKTMNRFAHSADHPVQNIDLHETLELSAKLSKRVVEMRDISLVVDARDESVSITTSLYHLLNLIWICINTALENITPGGSITLSSGKNDECATISIRMSPPTDTIQSVLLPDYADNFCRNLGLSVATDTAKAEIVISYH